MSGESSERKKATLSLGDGKVIPFIPALIWLGLKGSGKALKKLEDIENFLLKVADDLF